MGSTDLAGWAEVIRAASPILGALIALVGVLFSIWHSGRQEKRRMEHELEARLRDERLRAYSHLLTATAVLRMAEPELTENRVRVSEAFSEVQLVAGSTKVTEAAFSVQRQYKETVDLGVKAMGKDNDSDQETEYIVSVEALRAYVLEFLVLVKEELGLPLRIPLTGDLATSTDSEAGPNT